MYHLNKRVVTFLPPESIEPDALKQILNIAELPIIFHHVAVMPDCHVGKGATDDPFDGCISCGPDFTNKWQRQSSFFFEPNFRVDSLVRLVSEVFNFNL